MNDNLPFKYCNDDELNDILSVEINKVKTNTDTKITSSILAQNLPFHKCSDFVMLTECVRERSQRTSPKNLNFLIPPPPLVLIRPH